MRAELTRDIQSAADRLNRLVANLLDMSRLDAGRLKLKLDWCDVGEVIGVAAQRVDGSLLHRPLNIDRAARSAAGADGFRADGAGAGEFAGQCLQLHAAGGADQH